MGDGGVACVSSQPIMERFSISETYCGGKNGTKLNSKSSLKLASRKMKMKMKVKRENLGRRSESGKGELAVKIVKEVENGEIDAEEAVKEEVEEGELGTLKWPRLDVENGVFIPEKPLRKFEIKSEIERGEFSIGKWTKDEWRKGQAEKGNFSSGRFRSDDIPDRTGKTESGLWRSPKDELENGEFVPERWRRSQVMKDEYSYSKMRRHDPAKDKGLKYEFEPTGKHAGNKEFSRSGVQHIKRPFRYEANQERAPKISSKIIDEEDSFRSELSNGKNNGRESSSANRLKRHISDSDSSDRKLQNESGEYTSSKSRRLSDDGNRSTYSEHYSCRSTERSYRNSSSRNMSTEKYASRNYDSSVSSRVVHDRHNCSSHHTEKSPWDRVRNYEHRDRSPIRRDRSPYDRSRRNQSPSYSPYDPRDRTSSFWERSPLDRHRPSNSRESGRRSGGSEKRQSHCGSKGQQEKLNQRDSKGRESQLSSKESQDRSNANDCNGSMEKSASYQFHKEERSRSPSVSCRESPQVNGIPEELVSMEEDMDICDTPPHVPVLADSTCGKWFYLDHFGVERGPSRLCDLKTLVDDGFLVSDHLIKHLDSDRWVTVENAVSPFVCVSFPSIVSDTVTQLVSPPEAPGNLLTDTGDGLQSVNQDGEQVLPTSADSVSCPNEDFGVLEPLENLHIDQRVGALLQGFLVIPGRELETVGEALQMMFDHDEWDKWGSFEGECYDQRTGAGACFVSDLDLKDPLDSRSNVTTLFNKENPPAYGDADGWFSGRWSCKGGDWMRNDETALDKSFIRKFVLNDGYPLCQMPNSGFEDPRWQQKDELYFPSHSRRLDLPAWAFSSTDESKPVVVRGVKGTMLPVIRINACVVKDHGSFVSEPRTKTKGKERYSSRSSWPHSTTSDAKRSSEEGGSHSKVHEQGSRNSWKNISFINIPKDHLCSAEDLQLHVGDWYYIDGAGHERGPLSFSEMKVLADQGIIQKHSSIFRKDDRVWVPVSSSTKASDAAVKIQHENDSTSSDHYRISLSRAQVGALSEGGTNSSSFHWLHPQFIGYTRGKLHELVMKSYRSREFAAAINEVLELWINARQPKKEMERHIYNPAANTRFQKSDQFHAGRRSRLLADASEEEFEMEDESFIQNEDNLFDDICEDTVFCKAEDAGSGLELGSWGLLDGHILGRIFHYLRADFKSLVYAALTCKHWRSVVKSYREISRQVDLSSVASNCTDSMIRNIMSVYNREKIGSLVLRGCTRITSSILEEMLQSLPSLSSIDIRDCGQFEDLADKYPNINWFKGRVLQSKIRSLKHITENTSVGLRTYNGLASYMDESSGLKDYLESLDKRDSVNQSFRQNLYKRSKLYDARRSSSILSRDAHLRRLAMKKSENGYKRMEEYLSLTLKDIMKENTFDFFVPKVEDIKEKMKDGYYARRGLNSIKDDIARMCRDAIKVKNQGDSREMNRIISLFIRLATSLEGGSKFSYERTETMNILKGDSPPGFCSASSKYKKNHTKVTERKYLAKSNGSFDFGVDVSDREIRRRLLKLNKKSVDSGSETSDDFDRYSEETVTDSDGSASDTESNSDVQSVVTWDSKGDAYFTADDGLDYLADDREWGARMTKAGLVPPVTRKYDIIDHYVIVADEEEVQRKMRVSLPEDYCEKLNAQKNAQEESDFPEVKEYKPRKLLGDEVIEQEVYGIDPYTHNLLLDSMPEELDWSLQDKHLFIEDVLLCTLNKQVRHFTGSGNTPMVYPLKGVVEEILETAEDNYDKRTVKLCQFILKAMENRPDDNYVAYRKGLGVVCNKKGGFGQDDFVVEFLGEVYPAWKWFEKQDGIRSLQKDNKDPAPEFYNIYLERPKGDADGYDLVVVDAMHKANYASRICHSCKPNSEAKVTAVDGKYQIGIYTVRPIAYGEEVTFDYNSVTESKEEYEASVCLCGSQICHGSYLNLTGEGAFQMVLNEFHGILDRHQLMLEACELNSVSEEDYIDLGKAGLGSCLLGGLPNWLIAYVARLVRFINFERTKLPEEILRHNLEEKRKYFVDISMEYEKADAEVQAEGVYNQRLQNLALTIDKVRYVMRCIFGDPKKAPPPLEKLSPEEAVAYLWKGEASFVEELIQCMAPHLEDGVVNELRSKICDRDPSGSHDIQRERRKSLIWLRDEVRNLPCTYKSCHEAAADLIHIYAHTKSFFRIREYKTVTSPPVYISPLDLGPKYADKLGSGCHEYCKTYGENYCLGQLIFWHIQNNAEPDRTLARASRGCLSLPDVGSFYGKIQKPSRQHVYGPRAVKFMLSRMEKLPQRPWPKDRIWSFKSSPKVLGSPMLDAVLHNVPLDTDMVHWLKHRPAIFQAMWDG